MKHIDLILVEDSEVDGQLLKRIMRKEELTEDYVWMKDGSQVLEYFKDEKAPLPTAILLDIKLPKVNGLDVLKEIRSAERTKNIPIVMYSSSFRKDDIETAYKYGANSYLTKPTGFADMKHQFINFFNYWIKLNRSTVKFQG